MQKRCSGPKGRLNNVVDFKCRTCLNQTVVNDDNNKVRLENIEDEVVDQFGLLMKCEAQTEVSSISFVWSS